jgi:hypothetical protein
VNREGVRTSRRVCTAFAVTLIIDAKGVQVADEPSLPDKAVPLRDPMDRNRAGAQREWRDPISKFEQRIDRRQSWQHCPIASGN